MPESPYNSFHVDYVPDVSTMTTANDDAIPAF